MKSAIICTVMHSLTPKLWLSTSGKILPCQKQTDTSSVHFAEGQGERQPLNDKNKTGPEELGRKPGPYILIRESVTVADSLLRQVHIINALGTKKVLQPNDYHLSDRYLLTMKRITPKSTSRQRRTDNGERLLQFCADHQLFMVLYANSRNITTARRGLQLTQCLTIDVFGALPEPSENTGSAMLKYVEWYSKEKLTNDSSTWHGLRWLGHVFRIPVDRFS
ncbi:hypothetical protein CLF_111797 [Clonorchis sinensis]|uniref:Uncharacterized protein n=1 Tax=Clonorchis sinensis TaxID=79923 RepID=G7YVC6_CLOSI|nr:hypothetical protein CLF_111797 [Clonorchis sinensis]